MSMESAIANDVTPGLRQATAMASARPKPRAEILAVASILLGAIAQLTMKGALLLWGAHHGKPEFALSMARPAAGVLLGLLIYATGTLFWLKAVARASISYLYPLSAASYALVAVGGHFLFGERIEAGRWIGIAVITLGVALLALKNLGGSE